MDEISLKEYIDLKAAHLSEVANLRAQLNELAINKQEVAINERMDASNNKFALLKEQAAEFPSNADLKALSDKVDLLSKLVYIGLGAVMVLEFIGRFLIK